MEPPPLDALVDRHLNNLKPEDKAAGESIFGAIAAGKELSRKIVEGLRKNVGLDRHQIHHQALPDCTDSGQHPVVVPTDGEHEGVDDDIWALRERRSHSLPNGQAGRRKLRFRRSQAISFFKSRRDMGAQFTPGPKAAQEDLFVAVTDQELSASIFRQGLLTTVSAVLGMAFCTMAVITLPSTDLRWVVSADGNGEGAPTVLFSSWAIQLYGLLAACLFLVGFAWLGECKWPRNSSYCHDVLKKSLSRAEEAEQRAHKAHHAKQQFMAYVFHNIRVPFNAIVLGLGHLRSNADKELSSNEINENTDLIQMMLDCAETMTSVLDDVTDMGHWEEGVMELNLEEFDLLGLVKFLSWGLKDLLYQKQMCFSMSVDPIAKAVLSSNHVLGDKHRVLQTLGNFLSNAVKFSPAGGRLELNIKCEEVFQSDASSQCKAGVLHKAVSEKIQDCSLCPCLRVEGLSKSSKMPLSAPRVHGCCGQGSFAKVLITVKDTGIGISVQDQAKLFEPYSFVSSGWVQKAGVSGLGLSMAKRFAEQSGGYIGVESKEGEGSKFYFCLPYPLIPINYGVEYKVPSKEEWRDAFMMEDYKEESCTLGRSVSGKSDGNIMKRENFPVRSSSPADKGRRRVLLVEDTEINRIILRKVLQNLNLSCEEAENGQVAVDLLKQGQTFDLILMDKEMPVMDGHEATRQLRLMGVKTPIVALTGNALQSDRELFLEAGVDDFQTKPLSRDKLVQVLSRFGVKSSCA